MTTNYTVVRTRSGNETHLGEPGRSIVAGHQLPSARSITFRAYVKAVTCQRCRETEAFRTMAANGSVQ